MSISADRSFVINSLCLTPFRIACPSRRVVALAARCADTADMMGWLSIVLRIIWSSVPPLGLSTLRVCRAYFNGWPMVKFNLWWKRQPNHVAVDSKSILEDINITCDIPYGDGEFETVDLLMPCQPTPDMPPVLYAHGGGFVAVSSMLLNSSVTPIARAGCILFSIDYPLAPEHPWPAAALSTLRAIRYIRKRTGADQIALVGDSAGGNLVAYAAALLTDRGMLAALAAHTGEDLLAWEFPTVSRVCSIYGFLDDESWRCTRLAPALEWCWQSYFAPNGGGCGSGADVVHLSGGVEETRWNAQPDAGLARHLLEFEPSRLEAFPPTLLLGATGDPLVESTRRAAEFLRAAGVAVDLHEFDAPHGFLGVPPQWTLGFWRCVCCMQLASLGCIWMLVDLDGPTFTLMQTALAPS